MSGRRDGSSESFLVRLKSRPGHMNEERKKEDMRKFEYFRSCTEFVAHSTITVEKSLS